MSPDLSGDHPDHDQLRQFSVGLGLSAATTAIEEHIRHCPACWAILAELPASDAFLDGLRKASSEEG